MKRIPWTLLAAVAVAFSTCLPAQAGGGFGRRGRPEMQQERQEQRQEQRREGQEPGRPEQRPDAQGPRRERQGQRQEQVPVELLRQQLRLRVMHLRQQAERLQELRQHAGRGERPQVGRGQMQRGRSQAGRQHGFGGGRAWQQGGGQRHRPGMAGPGFRGGRGTIQPPASAPRGPAVGRHLPPEVRERIRDRVQRAVESFRATRQHAGRRGGDRPEMKPKAQRRGRELEA